MSTVNETLDKLGLNWTVSKRNLKTDDMDDISLPEHIAIIRDDTKKPLAVHSKIYQPFQNHELIELLERITNKVGLPIVNGGMFGGGQKIYVQLKSGDLRLGNDMVRGYVTGLNSFDGSTSLAFGPSNITISCMNSFFAAFRGLRTKVRHTKNMAIKVEEVAKQLELSIREEKDIFQSIKRLAEEPIKEDDMDWVTRLLFDITKDIDLDDEEEISTAKRKKLITFSSDVVSELNDKGENLWGLFSGVTKYTTHHLSKGDNLQSKMIGVYGNRERSIFTKLVERVTV